MTEQISSSDSTALRDDAVLRRVRYLGSARSGLQEWRLQRWTAILLVPLGLYFVASVLRLVTTNRTAASAWLSAPVPALLVIALMIAAIGHALVGMRSILADYVRGSGLRLLADIVLRGIAILLFIASILAVLHLFLTK